MATPSLSRTLLPPPPEKKKVLINLRSRDTLTSLVFVVFSLIVIVSFLYLSSFNEIASQGGIIHDLELRRSQLMREGETWNQRITNLKSLDVIEQQDAVKKMPPVVPSEIEFIEIGPKK